MKKIVYYLLMCININFVNAQNLVINPSMEDTIACALYPWDNTEPCIPWLEPTSGSADYFSSAYGLSCGLNPSVPQSVFGFQYAIDGIAYLGFSIYNIPPSVNYREYVEGTLINTLQANHTYCVSFYVSSADNCHFVTDDIGLYFSTVLYTDYNTANNLPLTPQIENPQGNILSDTSNWTLISGNYTALGGEGYFIIGNFKNDANTTLDTISGAAHQFGYYFLDEVSVVDCTGVGINETENKNGISVYPNPANEKLYINLKNNKNEVAKVIVCDLLGTIIKEADLVIGKSITEIDLTSFKPGVYFVKVFINDKLKLCEKVIFIK